MFGWYFDFAIMINTNDETSQTFETSTMSNIIKNLTDT